MGTYSKPGTAVSPMMVDKSMSLLSKELGVAGDALIKQKENILITQNQLAAENAILDQRVHSAQGGANLEFKDNLINTLSTSIDDIQKLGLNSIGRDQTEYMRAKAGLSTAVDQLPKLLAVLDEEAKAYNNVGDGARKILNSTDPLAREFMNDIRLNNGKNVRSEVVDGNVVLKYTGKNGKEFVLNGANYMTARENGTGDIIKYATDHNPEWKTVFDSLTSDNNYRALTEKIQSEIKDNKQTVETTKQWTEANASLRNKLENSTTLLPTLDESAWQFFNPGKEWNGSEEQLQGLRSQVIDEIMNNYAATDQITSEIQTDVTPTEKEKIDLERAKQSLRNLQLGAKKLKKDLKGKEENDDYLEIFKSEVNSVESILNADNPLEEYANQIRRGYTSGKVPNFKQSKSNPDQLVRIDYLGTEREVEVPIISLSEIESMDPKDLIRKINSDLGKDNMIPTKDLSRYLREINFETSEEEIVEEVVEKDVDTEETVEKSTKPKILDEKELQERSDKLINKSISNLNYKNIINQVEDRYKKVVQQATKGKENKYLNNVIKDIFDGNNLDKYEDDLVKALQPIVDKELKYYKFILDEEQVINVIPKRDEAFIKTAPVGTIIYTPAKRHHQKQKDGSWLDVSTRFK
jgi:hypothetical protein